MAYLFFYLARKLLMDVLVFNICGTSGLISPRLQLQEMINKAAAHARQWIRRAQEAAQGGKLPMKRFCIIGLLTFSIVLVNQWINMFLDVELL